MNFLAQESAQKLRGGFYTEPAIASFLAKWALEKKPQTVLEPSCGDGAFLEAILARDPMWARSIFACEINEAEAAKARARMAKAPTRSVHIQDGDFLQWFLLQGPHHPRFDAIVGNPPFIRYQYLAEEQQVSSERIIRQLGLPFTKHINAWVPFVVASIRLLAPGGRLAMVVPSELFHIPHAEAARRALVAYCTQTLILDLEDLWFDEVLQGVVLLLAEKAEAGVTGAGRIAAQSVRKSQILAQSAASYFHSARFVTAPKGKWMPVFLSEKTRSLLDALSADSHFARFEQLAQVDVGIVTGANKFFLVSDAIVEEFQLQRWAHPMIGRSEHITGVIYDLADHALNSSAGQPTNFLWFDDFLPAAFPARVQAYFRAGEKEKLPWRYKCRVRKPWFRVPSVYAAPVSMLKRAHHFPRLILNQANVFTTDTAYRIKLKAVAAPTLVYSFVNSLTALSAELEGRHYGGGVLELVPSEIERLLLPLAEPGVDDLESLDRRIRARPHPSDLLTQQDAHLLASQGVGRSDRATIHQAWDQLRQRRQRLDVADRSPGEGG